jgi:hypothetical protein
MDSFKITIDDNDELGIAKIAYTKDPAIEIKGMSFKSADLHPNCRCEIIAGQIVTEADACDYCLEKAMNFSRETFFFSNEEKMRIAAPLIIPKKIYRIDEDGYEFYVEFTTDVIEKLYHRMMKNLENKNMFNYEHTEEIVPSYILEAIHIDTDNKVKYIKDEYNLDVPLYSVFIVSQITDREYFNKLKEEGATGYSIEGLLGLSLSSIKNKMSNMKLPKGEHQIGDKIYVIGEEGEVIKIKDVEMETEKEEKEVEMETEKEKEEETEMETEEEKEVEMEETASIEEQVMVIVQPLFDTLIDRIAKLEAELESKNVSEEKEQTELKLSLGDRLKMASKFSNLK